MTFFQPELRPELTVIESLGGQSSVPAFFMRFFIPALPGNITGGVAFAAAVNHARVSAGGSKPARGSRP
jgi:formate/nitrite transporter FocA (FNT family)